MDRTIRPEQSDSPLEGRRKFLKQVAITAAMTGAAVHPAWAEEKSVSPMTPSSSAGQPLIAETLARYATSLKYDDLPVEVVREAKRFLIDTIGCGIGGFAAEPSQIANKLAAGVSAVHGATVCAAALKQVPNSPSSQTA